MNGLEIKTITNNIKKTSMKKQIILACVIFFMIPFIVISQSTFSYDVVEDNPDSGNRLFAGVGTNTSPLNAKHSTNFPLGPEIAAYNIFNRFALKSSAHFQTGIRLFTLDEKSDFLTKYFSADMIIITDLFSSYKTKKGKVSLKSDGNVEYVSYVEHKRKRCLGLRLGFGTVNAPLKRHYTFTDVFYNDTLPVTLYGYNQQNISFGISYTTLSNLTINTDLFGLVKKNNVSSFYADVLFPINTKGKHLVYVVDASTNNSDLLLIEMETPENYLANKLSFRFGWEKTQRLSNKVPIAGKIGVEIVRHQHFTLFQDLYIQFKLGLMVLAIQ
jgi:hypothetical protein